MIINARNAAKLALPALVLTLSIAAFAAPAQAATRHHHPAPTVPPVSSPAPAPVATTPSPAPAPAPSPIAVSGSVTRVASIFSAGGYSLQTYTVKVATAGTFYVKYTVGFGGGQIRTFVDGVEMGKLTGAGTDGPGISGSFLLSTGTHTIGTQSPDGYGQTDIDLIRVS